MVFPQTKTFIAGGGLALAAIVSFNGFIWQVQRRRWKDQMIASWVNMDKPPLTALPPMGETIQEYTPLELTGTLDNEGSVVVGPRPMPLRRNVPQADDARAGFVVLTPFEEDGTGLTIMVNRGWVPIDAAKTRLQRVQYTGDGFKHVTIRGLARKEENVSSWIWGENTDANNGPSIGVAWLACRPYEVLKDYYARRYGPEAVESRIERHGVRHWHIEMLEEFTGDDQRIVKGVTYPIRRSRDDMTHTSITPLVHGFYAAFWLTTGLMSCFMIRKVMVDHKKGVMLRKARDAVLAKDTSRLRDEQAAFNDQLQQVAKSGGNMGKLDLGDAARKAAEKARQIEAAQTAARTAANEEAASKWPKP